MNRIVTTKQCVRRIQSETVVGDPACDGFNQDYVIDVTTMNLCGDLVQWKGEMMLKGQKQRC